MNISSQADEEEHSSLSQGSVKMSSQNESKLNELSQMMSELKDEMIRLQHKNSCKINRVQDMVNGLSDTVKAKEKAAKEPAKEAAKEANSSPAHYTEHIQLPAANSHQQEGQGTRRSPSQTRSLPPTTPPPMATPPELPLTPRSLSPPPFGSLPQIFLAPLPPRSYQRSNHKSYSHGDQRRIPRHMCPDPANGNILKAALRVVNELDFDELRYLKRHLHYQLSD